ncbi:MAG: hypothetical protein HKO85_11165 [Xanthomonadales bacterium]|nr:hypothetical protein [Gammaproteobacteria bacterium]MBT8050389.1 hypothetical protein [Gammaproteobacteria bacterium]MBT8055913.1 hypothetical protein [Gammaproteobacteria bacterium]NNL05837.1 hypothetical protein [Xanthomonadales bacterium]
MNKTFVISALIVVGSLGFATMASAQDVSCDDLVYAPDVLADNPNIGDACLDVVEKGGTMAAKFRARVVRQSVNSTIVQWQLPDGSWSASQRRYPQRNAYAELSGEKVRIVDMADRQEVNVYLPMNTAWTVPMAAQAEAMADEAEPMVMEEEAAPPPPPPAPAPVEEEAPVMLPTTATQVPAFALLGGLLLLLGGAVSFVRTRL